MQMVTTSAPHDTENLRIDAYASTVAELTCEVRQVTAVTAGEVNTRITPGPDAAVTVWIGTAMLRIGSPQAARVIADVWRTAAVHLPRMKERAQLSPHSSGSVTPVGLVFTIGPNIISNSVFNGSDDPRRHGHLLVQVGPMLWAVLDRTAYWRIREVWEEVERELR